MSYNIIIHSSERGQIVIPGKIRKALKIEKGTALKITLLDSAKVVLEPMPSFAKSLKGSAKKLFKGKDILKGIVSLREDR